MDLAKDAVPMNTSKADVHDTGKRLVLYYARPS